MAKDLTRTSESSDLHNTDMPMPSMNLDHLDLSALRYTLGKPVFSKDDLPEGARITPIDVSHSLSASVSGSASPSREELRKRLHARMKIARESRTPSSS